MVLGEVWAVRMQALIVERAPLVHKGEELRLDGSRMEKPHQSLIELRQIPVPPQPLYTHRSVSIDEQYVAYNFMRNHAQIALCGHIYVFLFVC